MARRSLSPGGRRVVQGGHSSTGTLIFPSAFDQFQGPSRSSIGFSSGPRTSAERILAPRVIPRYRPESPRKSSRDDYVIHPRRQTLDPQDAATRRPLSLISPSSPNRARPIITSAVERSSSPVRSRYEEDYYIQPSTTREHRRNYTASSTDTSRLNKGERLEHSGYQRSGGGRTGYNMNQPLVRPQDRDDRTYYNDRREQLHHRDIAPRARPRRDSSASRHERPRSMTVPEDYNPYINQPSRDSRPPASMETRGFTNMGRSNSLRQGQRARDDEILSRDYPREEYDMPKTRKPLRPPVSLHQEPVEVYYREGSKDITDGRHRKHHKHSYEDERSDTKPKLRDEFGEYDRGGDDRKKHHEKHYRRDHDGEDWDRRMREDLSRNSKSDRGDEISTNGLLASAAASAAAASTAVEGVRRYRRERERGDRDDDREKIAAEQDSLVSAGHKFEASDEERRERHRRRRREREERDAEDRKRESVQAAAQSVLQVTPQAAPPPENVPHEQGSYERLAHHKTTNAEEPLQPSRNHHRHHSHSYDEDSYSSSSSSSRDNDPPENRQRQVRVVDPSEEPPHEPEPPIKGILRPPREKFPDDPAPIREGVAPLKDAGTKGIPPNARWTKIDRKLVNPEALTEGKERFEERPDHVIVLRVLKKEEIEAYALKTREIREKRGFLTMGGGGGAGGGGGGD